MRVEVPTCARCCFCLPLRYGLIVWGYLKLFLNFLTTMSLTLALDSAATRSMSADNAYKIQTADIIILSILGCIALADLVLTIIYIVGCHKKSGKLLRIFYVYSIIMLILASAFSLYVVCSTTYYIYTYTSVMIWSVIIHSMLGAMMAFANIALQIYMMLLIRSEIVKLNSQGQCRFVNHAAEAQCNLQVDYENSGKECEKNRIEADNYYDKRIYA